MISFKKEIIPITYLLLDKYLLGLTIWLDDVNTAASDAVDLGTIDGIDVSSTVWTQLDVADANGIIINELHLCFAFSIRNHEDEILLYFCFLEEWIQESR